MAESNKADMNIQTHGQDKLKNILNGTLPALSICFSDACSSLVNATSEILVSPASGQMLSQGRQLTELLEPTPLGEGAGLVCAVPYIKKKCQ